MSRSVDLFIGSPLPIAELADLLHTRSGAQLLPTTDPERWRFIEGSVTAELFEHPYVDDGELWLSRYRYVLSARMADGVGPLDSAEVLGLRHLAQVLHDPVKLPVLLVLDLQYRLGPSGGRSRSAPGPDPRRDPGEPGMNLAPEPGEPGMDLAGERAEPAVPGGGWPA
jgi:hypothetical protein